MAPECRPIIPDTAVLKGRAAPVRLRAVAAFGRECVPRRGKMVRNAQPVLGAALATAPGAPNGMPGSARAACGARERFAQVVQLLACENQSRDARSIYLTHTQHGARMQSGRGLAACLFMQINYTMRTGCC